MGELGYCFMKEKVTDPLRKAFEMNLDSGFYGVFAEIGAGQEVARYFFKAGGASGTVAKSMSAYGMEVSNEIYGKSQRYVSKERVEKMLSKEFNQLDSRLEKNKNDNNIRIFSFANTVAAKSYNYKRECHGWVGMSFQHRPGVKPSQVIIHMIMHDKENFQQQEVLGIIGTNLIYSCFRYVKQQEVFIDSLMDSISLGRVKIDFIEVSGEAFSGEDSRVWSLGLVKRKYCDVIMFNTEGKMVSVKETLYEKNILVSRGSYRPPTRVSVDMLLRGKDEFQSYLREKSDKNILTLPEISMSRLLERGQVDNVDFLARINLLSSLGYNSLISNFFTYVELVSYLRGLTCKRLGLLLSYYNLVEVFDHNRGKKELGDIFKDMGELMGDRSRIFVYPSVCDNDSSKILSTQEADVASHMKTLIKYSVDQSLLMDIKNYDKNVLNIWSRSVLEMIQNNAEGWEKMVPSKIADAIKKDYLFGFPHSSSEE